VIYAKEQMGFGGFFMINKQSVRDYGYEASLLFSVIVDAENLFEDEWFYQTVELISGLTYNILKKRNIADSVQKLTTDELIQVKDFGLPKRRHFKLNKSKIIETFGLNGDDSMAVKDMIGQQAFFLINKKLVKELGWEAAWFLSILSDAEKMFADDDVNAGYVFQTTPTVEAMSMGVLTRRKQETGIKSLIDAGVISQKNIGLPMKRHFKIHPRKLAEVFARE
jgi:hypothetical protein